MPTIINCKECGHVLAKYETVPPSSATRGANWLPNLLLELKGKCPKCGHELPTASEFAEKMQFKVDPNPETLGKPPLASAFKHNYHKPKRGRPKGSKTQPKPYQPRRDEKHFWPP